MAFWHGLLLAFLRGNSSRKIHRTEPDRDESGITDDLPFSKHRNIEIMFSFSILTDKDREGIKSCNYRSI